MNKPVIDYGKAKDYSEELYKRLLTIVHNARYDSEVSDDIMVGMIILTISDNVKKFTDDSNLKKALEN